METESLIKAVVKEANKLFAPRDALFFHEFLSNGELGLAIEFLCDQLFEYDVEIPPGFAQKLTVLSGKLDLSPRRSWNFLLVKGPRSNASYRLRSDAPVVVDAVFEIFEKVESRIARDVAAYIQDWLDDNDVTLALENIHQALVQGNISLSVQDVRSSDCLV